MLWCFVFSFLGLMIGFRMIDFLIHHQIYERQYQKLFSVVLVVIVFLVGNVLKGSAGLSLLVLAVAWFLPAVALLIQEIVRRSDFERNILPYLDSILISLQMGRSFREALSELCRGQSGPGQFYLQELNSLLQFSNFERKKSKSALFEEVLIEFLALNRSSHKVYDQVKALRRKISTRQNFQKKAKQVTAQVRAQALILLFLYIALFAYTLCTHSFYKTQKILFVSMALFILGAWINYRVPRGFKWKT